MRTVRCRFFSGGIMLGRLRREFKVSRKEFGVETRVCFLKHFQLNSRELFKMSSRKLEATSFPLNLHPFVFIYFQHSLSETTLDMCEWYDIRVWNRTDCFPIPHFLCCSVHIHKYFATSSLEGSALELQKGRVMETHKWNIKIICLTHIFFHLAGDGEEGRAHNKVISSILFSKAHSEMRMLHEKETTQKIINGKMKIYSMNTKWVCSPRMRGVVECGVAYVEWILMRRSD